MEVQTMSAKPWSGKTIVIVEDAASVAAELVNLYQAAGMKVVGQADNGVKALQLVADLRPDLVSLDVVMPEMDGVECYYKLKQAGEKGKIFFVTWLATEPKALESLRNAVPDAEFLTKVPTAKALEEALLRVYDPSLRVVALSKADTVSEDYLGDLGVKSA